MRLKKMKKILMTWMANQINNFDCEEEVNKILK